MLFCKFFEYNISNISPLNLSFINDPKMPLDINFSSKISNSANNSLLFDEEFSNIFASEQKQYKEEKSLLENILNKEIIELEEKTENPALPAFYSYSKIIKEIFPKINNLDDLEKNFVMDINLRKIEQGLSLLGKKKRKSKLKYNDIYESTNKLGRRHLNDYSKRRHNKSSEDNIIKKIKSKFIEYSLKFINKVLNSNLNKKNKSYYNYLLRKTKKEDDCENLIKSLDYKIVHTIKRETDLSLLDKSLKDVFSQDISTKYSSLSYDSNKIIITRILADEKDNKTIMFAFNLTLREWIEVFIYKKELKDIKNINNLSEEKINQLSSLFDRVDKLLLDIYQKDSNKNYLSHFISLMYNYERWFFIKKGRKRIS